MIGAIAGDVIGSVHEYTATKTTDFPLFVPESRLTDDSVLSVAVADCLLSGKSYGTTFREYCKRYPGGGYGQRFWEWARSSSTEPYNSFGNGSAMRVSPVGWVFDTLEEVVAEARRSAEVTHNHPEGIKGAEATAASIFIARTGKNKADIRTWIEKEIGYDLQRTVDEIRPGYTFNETCQHTVPEAIIAFLDSKNFEDAIRNSISLGGDADTLACITGSIAEAFYGGVPDEIADQVMEKLDNELTTVVDDFTRIYVKPKLRGASCSQPASSSWV